MQSESLPNSGQRFEYRLRFTRDGQIVGESLYPALGARLGIALEAGEAPHIQEYLKRLETLDPMLPERLSRRVGKLIEHDEEFALNGDYSQGGKDYHLHFSGRAVRDLDGAHEYTLLILDDTEQTQIRRVYEYMFRLASHEIKGPLACVLGAAEYAALDLAAGRHDAVQTCLDMIYRNAQTMEDMLTRYLNLSRIESGIFVVKAADIILSDDVLNHVLIEMKTRLRDKDMRVEFKHPGLDREPAIHADADMMAIVLRNLISNAIKYGNPHTLIEVWLERRDDLFSISVRNVGPNIPKYFLDKLFKKFMRLEATQGSKGSGLGLYNSRKIVELWGGTIGVRSTEAHTTFTFTLPAA